jgi:HD-like signal output (HDOD) protein
MEEKVLAHIRLLPPLDESVGEIQTICMNPDSSLQDLVKVVEKDPMLTANILKATNSPLFGFSKEITNISQAVSLFGMATVRGFALSSAVRSSLNMDLTSYGTTTDRLIKTSELHNIIAYNWYRKVNIQALEILMPASFLMEIGKVIISGVMEKELKESFKTRVTQAGDIAQIAQIEKDIVGLTNEEVAAKVFELWNFEESIVEAIAHSSAPLACTDNDAVQEAAKVLHVLKTTLSANFSANESSIKRARELLQGYGMGSEHYDSALEILKR